MYCLVGDHTPRVSQSREHTPTPHVPTAASNPLLDSIEVTPRTSQRLAQLKSPIRPVNGTTNGQTTDGQSAVKKPPTKKSRMQLFDAVTELDGNGAGRLGGLGSQGGSQSMGAAGAMSRAEKIAAGLYIEPNYLPKNRYELACLEIRLNPSRNRCLPKTVMEGGSQWLLAAPPGVCAELTNLFKFPAPAQTGLPPARHKAGNDTQANAPRQRSGTVDSEVGRRREEGMGEISGFDHGLLDVTFDEADERSGMVIDGGDGPILEDDFRFEMDSNHERAVDEDVQQPGVEDNYRRSVSRLATDPPNPSTGTRTRAEGESSLLDLFDDLSEPQATQLMPASQDENKAAGATKWSKNTVKALKVLKEQLGKDHVEEDSEEKAVMQFEKVSEKVSYSFVGSDVVSAGPVVLKRWFGTS